MTSSRSIVVFGDCQADGIYRTVSALPEIREAYSVTMHSVARFAHEKGRWPSDIANADILLCQDIAHTPAYLSHVSPGGRTRVVSFPSLFFGSLWPFDGVSGAFDRVAIAHREAGGAGLDFEFQDNLMARLRIAIPDHNARYDAYRALFAPKDLALTRYFSRLNFARMLELEMHRMVKMDERYELKIYAFILSHFRAAPLFHTCSHPNGIILLVLAAQCLAKAGINVVPKAENVVHHGSHFEVPVHPLVGQRLGVAWADDNTRYQFRDWVVTFEEYFRAYIATYG